MGLDPGVGQHPKGMNGEFSAVYSEDVSLSGIRPPVPKLTGMALDAVRHRGSHVQIIAAAGSGKTEVVSQRVADLLAEGFPAETSAPTPVDAPGLEVEQARRQALQ